jgi:hypothetical protein
MFEEGSLVILVAAAVTMAAQCARVYLLIVMDPLPPMIVAPSATLVHRKANGSHGAD